MSFSRHCKDIRPFGRMKFLLCKSCVATPHFKTAGASPRPTALKAAADFSAAALVFVSYFVNRIISELLKKQF